MWSDFGASRCVPMPCAAWLGTVRLIHPAGAGKLSVGHGSPGLSAALQASDWRGSATPLSETGEDWEGQCSAWPGGALLGSPTRRNAGRFVVRQGYVRRGVLWQCVDRQGSVITPAETLEDFAVRLGDARRGTARLGKSPSLRKSGAAFRL